MTRKVVVKADREACIGAGECMRLVPEAFDSDEDGYVVVRDVTGVDVELLRRAERQCPMQAIVVEEE